MKIIHNKKEFENNYFYKKDKPDKYPRRYPCIVDYVYTDGGLQGDYVEHKIVYFPSGVDHNSFFRGYVKGIENVD